VSHLPAGDGQPFVESPLNTSLVLSLPTVILAGLALAGPECHAPGGPDELPPPTFVAHPATVAPGDTFAVVFALHNPTRETVTIGSSYGCLFFLRAFRGSDPISMEGATYFCTAALRTFEVPPGESLRVTHTLVAAERNYPQAPTPLPAGIYRIQTQMNAALPDLEAEVTVVDPAGGRRFK
jgi:hypothetical protein